jgi:succinoglycan biosynthesis protein ExoU
MQYVGGVSRARSGRRVAVIIAVRNNETTIARAIYSARTEPEAAQVIVIDDASTDATAARARACDDGTGRLVVHTVANNLGPARARNLAIAMSDAPWVTPLDGDDFMLPGRLGKLLDQAEGCDFIADDLWMAQEGREGRPTKRMIGAGASLPLTLSFSSFVEANISQPGQPRQEYGFLKPLIRRDFLDRMQLGYDDLRLGEDFVLYARALALGARFRVVPACGYVAVQRPGSLSESHSTEDLRRLLAACVNLAHEIRLLPREAAVAYRHQRHLEAKIDHREVLEMKQAGGMAAAIRLMARRARNAPYMLRQKLVARAQQARSQRRHHPMIAQ